VRDTGDVWYRAFIHESGHAVMAALQGIRCHGIFMLKGPMKATALVPPFSHPLSEELKLLFLAAGSAAEELVLGQPDSAASKADRNLFGINQDAAFDEKVREAVVILSNHRPQIEKLAARLYGMYQKTGGDFTNFRPQPVKDENGHEVDYWVLLDEEELKEELKDVAAVR